MKLRIEDGTVVIDIPGTEPTNLVFEPDEETGGFFLTVTRGEGTYEVEEP